MALLGEIEIQRTTATSPGRLKVFYDVLEQGQRSEDGDFLFFVGLNAVFLRSDKVEERLCAGIEFVKFAIPALRPSFLTAVLVKDGEEECAVMQSTILDCVVQLGHLGTVG